MCTSQVGCWRGLSKEGAPELSLEGWEGASSIKGERRRPFQAEVTAQSGEHVEGRKEVRHAGQEAHGLGPCELKE